MKQIIVSVFFDILSYTIGIIIFCFFKFNNYRRVYKVNFFLV